MLGNPRAERWWSSVAGVVLRADPLRLHPALPARGASCSGCEAGLEQTVLRRASSREGRSAISWGDRSPTMRHSAAAVDAAPALAAGAPPGSRPAALAGGARWRAQLLALPCSMALVVIPNCPSCERGWGGSRRHWSGLAGRNRFAWGGATSGRCLLPQRV